MTDQNLPDEFLKFLETIAGKRARIVVQHILEHGFITTEDLENLYGYRHPPRAVRDVREHGVPIETFTVKNSQGRSIAAYRFGDVSQIHFSKAGGRRVFPKRLKEMLYAQQAGKCAVCLESYGERYLQVDHRVPYQVAGEPANIGDLSEFMLLCGSCNRAKSWSCEHCKNLLIDQVTEVCRECYWASPNQYNHIALRSIRRIEVVWSEHEVEDYESLKQLADEQNTAFPDYVKVVLRRHLRLRGG